MRRTAVSRIRSRERLPAISRISALTRASCSPRSRSAPKAMELATAMESCPAKRVTYSRSSLVKRGAPGFRVAFKTPNRADASVSWS